MNSTTTATKFTISLGLLTAICEISLFVSAFAPTPSTTMSSIKKVSASQINYIRESETNGFPGLITVDEDSFSATRSMNKNTDSYDNDDDFVDPMEEAFDNMKHPMELMLLSRACIPYVAEGKPEAPLSPKKASPKSAKQRLEDNFEGSDDEIDPMDEAFDNMKHPMELMLLHRACIPYVTEGKALSPVTKTNTEPNKPSNISKNNDNNDFIDPMEEAFDNMKHPMELMLLNRACIPYVTDSESSVNKRNTPNGSLSKPSSIVTNKVISTDDLEDDLEDFVDPMEEAFDNMKHPMELMLLNRACIPYVAM